MLYGWIAALLRPARVIVTIHDANNFFRSTFTLYPRKLVRHIGKKVLARYCSAFITVSEAMQRYITNTLGIQKQVSYVPAAIFDRGNNTPQAFAPSQRLRIVIPGSIDGRRRDYNKIFKLLEKINEHVIPVVIVLAGGPYKEYGQEIIEKCRVYASSNDNLVYYEAPVLDQSIFDMELDSCHFTWIPSVVKTTIADDIEETYGLTKSSGNVYDAVKHARPVLAPAALEMPVQLQSSTFAYQSIDALFDFLQSIIRSPNDYQRWAQQALSNAKTYTIENLREKIKPLL